jgi:hypothetical protein
VRTNVVAKSDHIARVHGGARERTC